MISLPHFEHVPACLKALKNWVCWRYERRDGRETKVPYCAKRPHALASVADPSTWASFDEAAQALMNRDFDGIGIVLTPEAGVVAFDFDHCRDELGEWHPSVMKLVRLLDSYTEVTPSGEGLRVLCYGTLPDGRAGLRRGKVEVYRSGRYISVTGDHLEGTPHAIEHRQQAIDKVCARMLEAKPKAAEKGETNTAAVGSDDAELLQRAMNAENGDRFRELWNTTDAAGYPSPSEADLALASMLMFWTGGDVQRAERLFTSSPRGQRRKWQERVDYRQQTFAKALEGKTDFYRGDIENEKLHTAGAQVEEEADLRSDYGHAAVLARLFAGQYRWAHHRGTWMHYNGKVWRPVPEEAVAKHAADVLRAEYSMQAAQAGLRRSQVNELAQKLKEACTHSRIAGALSFLRGWDGILTAPQEWDAEPYALNVENGTLDLRTMTLRPHNPDDLITKMANTDYDPAADGKRWTAHIERILPDAEIRRQVQRDLGVALVGCVLEESLSIWYGTGANGKTTTLRALLGILGDYADRAAPNLLIQSKYERHPTEIADLCGLRLVFSVEVEQGKRLAESLVKDLTGGDRKKARYMRQDFFSFDQTFTIVLVVNHKPIVYGTDEGIWRRIKLIPFTYHIPESERRPQDEVVAELTSEGAAILNWLLEGLRNWNSKRNWTAPAVEAMTEAYRAEMDILGDFLREKCEQTPRKTVPKRELYKAYIDWCAQNNERPISHKNFTQKLAERGIGEARAGHERTRVYVGIALRTDADTFSNSYIKNENSGRIWKNRPHVSALVDVLEDSPPEDPFATAECEGELAYDPKSGHWYPKYSDIRR